LCSSQRQHPFQTFERRRPKSVPTDKPHAISAVFAEKRTFFLEGADILSFGLGLNEDVIPNCPPAHRTGCRSARGDHYGSRRHGTGEAL
jgi:hypothetical protein